MLKPYFSTGLVFLALLVFTGSASATTFDFNAANLGVAGGSTQDSVAMTVDGITVTVTAYTIANNGSGIISARSRLSGGTGVYISHSADGNLGVRSNLTDDGTNLGGSSSREIANSDEGLLFTFDQAVRLDFINFDKFGHRAGDDFNLTVDGISRLVDYSATKFSLLVDNTPEPFDHYHFKSITGTRFLFWADSDTDSFRIDEMTVSAE